MASLPKGISEDYLTSPVPVLEVALANPSEVATLQDLLRQQLQSPTFISRLMVSRTNYFDLGVIALMPLGMCLSIQISNNSFAGSVSEVTPCCHSNLTQVNPNVLRCGLHNYEFPGTYMNPSTVYPLYDTMTEAFFDDPEEASSSNMYQLGESLHMAIASRGVDDFSAILMTQEITSLITALTEFQWQKVQSGK